MRKKTFFIMLTFIATMMVQAQNEYSTLVIETKAGTTMELSLQKKPRVAPLGIKEEGEE